MTIPFPYQKKGIRRIVNELDGRGLLADEMGLGKSLQAIISALMGDWFPIVIICPASLKMNWARECRIHLKMNAEIIEGKTPRKKWKPKHRIVIINYDILGKWLPYLRRMRAYIITDECHYVKNLKAKRTKNWRKLCKGQKRILCLSGTPLVNEPFELFAVVNTLWPEEFPSQFSFAMRYCKPEKTPWGWKFKGAKNLPELHTRLTDLGMIRRRKEDVLKDLPAKVRFVVPLSISDWKEYNKAEQDFINWLREKSPAKAERARHAMLMVRTGYLIRLACKLKFRSVENWVDNLLEESDKKYILLGKHIPPTTRLHERYKGISVCVTGEVKVPARQKLVDQFNDSKKTRLLIGNSPAWTGWNMTAAEGIAFYELAWTSGEHDQGEARAHRIGQKKKLSIWYLIAQGTIEEDVFDLLQEKHKTTSAVLDGQKEVDGIDIFTKLEEKFLTKGKRR